MRLIDADALKLYINKEVEEDKVLDGWAFFFKAYLDSAPTIDVDKSQGEWIDKWNWMGVECSRCKCHSRYVTPFCPYCGADMRERGKVDECL